jgi:hypothetical protein
MGLLQTKTEIIGGTGTPCSLMATLMLLPAIECSGAMINCYVHTEENDTHLIGSHWEHHYGNLLKHGYNILLVPMGNLSGQYYLIITTRTSISPNMSRTETALDELFRRDNILVNHFPMKSRKGCRDCQSRCQFYVKASHGCIQKEIQQRIGTVPIGNSVHVYQREALQD